MEVLHVHCLKRGQKKTGRRPVYKSFHFIKNTSCWNTGPLFILHYVQSGRRSKRSRATNVYQIVVGVFLYSL